MEIKTKYDIGQKLYWIDKYDNTYRIHFSNIKSINVGGKIWEKYEIGMTTRAERDLYTNFIACKEVCIEKQKANNDELLKEVEKYTDPANKF